MKLESSFNVNFVLKVHDIACVKVQRQKKKEKIEWYTSLARILIYHVPEGE